MLIWSGTEAKGGKWRGCCFLVNKGIWQLLGFSLRPHSAVTQPPECSVHEGAKSGCLLWSPLWNWKLLSRQIYFNISHSHTLKRADGDLRVRRNLLFYQDVCSVIFPTYYKSGAESQLETQDFCIAANQNTFWEWMEPIITFSLSSHAQLLTVPAQAHPEHQSSPDTTCDPLDCQTLEISAQWRRTPCVFTSQL